MNQTYWIWYPGDLELYYAMKQNFSRVERGCGWPAFWKSEGFRNRVTFRRTYELKEKTQFTVYSDSIGYVLAEDRKYPFGTRITCGPGRTQVSVHTANIAEFPSVYVEGTDIHSDGSWTAWDYDTPPVSAGTSKYYTRREQRPSRWEYTEKTCLPQKTEEVNGGVLYTFETEMTAVVKVVPKNGVHLQDLTVYLGESREEALDPVHCYLRWQPDSQTGECPCSAVRYAFLPGVGANDIGLTALWQYVDIPTKASFYSDDAQINRIWKVAEHTFKLCSGIFFLDGIKRDKWIWCGDAYQSIQVNEYLMADPEINRRTLLALRGNTHMTTHINTIVDYSLIWVLAVWAHYMAYADLAFVRQIYGKITSLMDFVMGQLDERGYLVGRPGDWIYIDWAEFDKTGPLCAEQMLLAKCYETMAALSQIAGLPEKESGAGETNSASVGSAGRLDSTAQTDSTQQTGGTLRAGSAAQTDGTQQTAGSAGRTGSTSDASSHVGCAADGPDIWRERAARLRTSIQHDFWDAEKHAFIDSFTSGKRNVTRHANIFAVIFDIVPEAQKREILEHVLHNPEIPHITTPYFKFYELDALCRLGCLSEVLDIIRTYWGGMLERGAVTFWEEFDPAEPVEEQYDMYGDRFGKSLCHAWAASPIYLLEKYFLGVKPLTPGGKSYEVQPPQESFFKELDCRVPVNGGLVHIRLHGGQLNVTPEGM